MIAGDNITVEMDMKVITEDYLTGPKGRAFYSRNAPRNSNRRNGMKGTITIRDSTSGDVPAILDLALLDGGEPPKGEALLAFVDGELRAAVSRADGAAVSDPFHLTADLVKLLRTQIAQERASAVGSQRLLARLTPVFRKEVHA
jgi:hypothetical protein